MALSVDQFVSEIETMSVLELNNLVKALETKFGVSAAMMAAPAAAATAASPAAAVEDEVWGEGRLHVRDDPGLDHRLGHVRPPDVLGAAGNLDHAVEGDRVAEFIELLHHPPRAGESSVAQRMEHVRERGIVEGDPEAQHVHLPLVVIERRDLACGDDFDPYRRCRCHRLGYATQGVVVGEGDGGKAQLVGPTYHLRRSIGPVGGGGVQLQVGKSVAQHDYWADLYASMRMRASSGRVNSGGGSSPP